MPMIDVQARDRPDARQLVLREPQPFSIVLSDDRSDDALLPGRAERDLFRFIRGRGGRHE